MTRTQGVSVIICCYNSAERITPTLEHIFAQQVSDALSWEVILVDNNCSDHTVKVAESVFNATDRSIHFSIINQPIAGLMNARKCGIEASKYEFMLFVDDDNWLSTSYLQLCFNLLNDLPKTAILGGYGSAASDNIPFWFTEFEGSFAVGKQAESSGVVPSVYGAGMCIRHKAWETLKQSQFKSLLLGRTGKVLTSGEDTEICYALRLLGYEIRYDDRLTFKHDLPMERLDWNYLRQLFFGFGLAKARIDIYSHALSGNPLPQDGRLPFWFNRITYLLIQLKSDIPIIIKGAIFNLEGNERLLKALGKLGHIKGIWQQRHNLTALYSQVASIKKSREINE